jgi:hypothetical protein
MPVAFWADVITLTPYATVFRAVNSPVSLSCSAQIDAMPAYSFCFDKFSFDNPFSASAKEQFAVPVFPTTFLCAFRVINVFTTPFLLITLAKITLRFKICKKQNKKISFFAIFYFSSVFYASFCCFGTIVYQVGEQITNDDNILSQMAQMDTDFVDFTD